MDLRCQKSSPDPSDFVSWTEGDELKTLIKAKAFVECSAMKYEQINEVIEAAIRASSERIHSSKRCTIS